MMAIYKKYYELNGNIDISMLKSSVLDVLGSNEKTYDKYIDYLNRKTNECNILECMLCENKVKVINKCIDFCRRKVLVFLLIVFIIFSFIFVLRHQYIELLIWSVLVNFVFRLYLSCLKFIYQYHKRIYFELKNLTQNRGKISLNNTLKRLVYWLKFYNLVIITDLVRIIISVVIFLLEHDTVNILTTILYILLIFDSTKQIIATSNELSAEKIELDAKLSKEKNKIYRLFIKIILKIEEEYL